MTTARFVLLALVAIAPALPASAQQRATLDQVDALVASGRTEDARAALMQWWEASAGARGGDAARRAELQRGLWLRGILTVDPAQAALDYQRLVVEHPGGPWTDRAMLRLAQTAEARGDHTRARDQLRALVRDYPASPLRPDAERLLASVEGAAPPASPAPELAVRAGAPSPATVVEPDPPSVADPVGAWTVQVGAFANPERARARRDELTAAGIDARLAMIPGNPLLRVRSGRFSDEDQAQALRRGLLARGFDATVSSDAEREETP